MNFEILVPPVLRFGAGSIAAVGDLARSLGVERPLIVTDGFLTSTGLSQRVADALADAGLEVSTFAGTIPDPTTDSLTAGLDAIGEHRADGIVALGGGSPIDTAKALSVLAVRGGEMRELKSPFRYAGPALPVIAVPTTAGTGSEVTMFTIITDTASDEKMLCAGRSYLPAAAIIDYELTMSMPPRLTADTGIDALTHAIEAYVSKRASPVSDLFALDAVTRIGHSLRAAYEDGSDSAARENVMLAATLAGIAFSNSSVALVHGMSRPLGAHFHIAHGMANAMLFPAITAFSSSAATSRYADCARALGVAGSDTPNEEATGALVRELRQLSRDTAVPTPATFGIDAAEWEAKIPLMAQQALASGSPANNPRVPDAAEIANLYREIYA